MRALYLLVIGFGNWGQMGMRLRAQELVMGPLEALTGAMKNVVAPAPQPPLPEAGTAVVSGTGTETEIGNGIETEIENGTEIETRSGTETGTGTGIGIENATGIETERALSADQTHSLNAGPRARGTLSMCMEKT